MHFPFQINSNRFSRDKSFRQKSCQYPLINYFALKVNEKEVDESKPKQPPHLFHYSCGQCFEIWGSKLALDFHMDVAHRKRR